MRTAALEVRRASFSGPMAGRVWNVSVGCKSCHSCIVVVSDPGQHGPNPDAVDEYLRGVGWRVEAEYDLCPDCKGQEPE